MRPTVTEQLQGMRRILGDVVTPHVADAYAREQLGHVATALGNLAASWDSVFPALRDENAALEALLRRILPDLEGLGVAEAVRSRAGAIVSEGPLPAGEMRFEPHHQRNQALRGCVVDVIAALDAVVETAAAARVRTAIDEALRRGLED